MVSEPKAQVSFTGSDAEQQLAERVFDLMSAHGRFMASNAPIRLSIASLASFFDAHPPKATAGEIKAAAEANPDVYAIEERNGEDVLVTTAAGHIPVAQQTSSEHSFAERLRTPLPKPEKPATPVRERVTVDPSWSTFIMPVGDIEAEAEEEAEEPAPVQPAATEEPTPPVVEIIAVEEPVELAPAAVEEPAAEAEAPVVAAPEPVAAPRLDLSGVTDEQIAAALVAQLGADPHVAHFADQWMAEDRVPRLSRGDLRRIKDYIDEQERPLDDATLASDILGLRPNAPDFALMRFAVNFRLMREHREFEFVGTNDQRFWSTPALPSIGTQRRKPNEIGTDFRYLVDELPTQDAPRSVSAVDHVLTFYEYTLGLLPFDADMQKLLARPVTEEQKVAVLTFEIPQSYATYLVELRYPTPNRGGFLLGLDDFFAESLVPGALLSITATENDGHYKLEYLPGQSQSARLLELDARRGQRYVFRPTTFECEVQPQMLLTEDRFPNLAADKPMDEKVRRRPDEVVRETFKRIGIDTGEGLLASADDLFAVVNIERPFSRELLRETLAGDAQINTDDDGDTWTYVAG